MSSPSFYLASHSPRRKELLTAWGFDFEVLSDKRMIEPDERPYPVEDPFEYVRRASIAKAVSAHAFLLAYPEIPMLPVLTADTIVFLDGKILRKPKDAKEATKMLKSLSGRAHTVMSAVSLAEIDGTISTKFSKSVVSFAPLSKEQIESYVASGEGMDKAGAYAIQGAAALFVDNLNGSYTGVVGLPAFETGILLNTIGINSTVSQKPNAPNE
ncbi:MAG: Maf family protein [Burkholderiales bacterium]|nr:Maf family protein [Burkholderiales bacterium]